MRSAELNRKFAEKIERGIFDGVRKGISWLPHPDDQFQEGLSSVWYLYRNAFKRGKVIPDNMLIWTLKRRVRTIKRVFTGRAGQKDDVLGGETVRRGEVSNQCFLEDSEEIPEQPNFTESRVDLIKWLDELDERDRAIMLGKYKGRSPTEIAQKVGLSIPQVDKRAKVLGKMFADRMGVTIHFTPKFEQVEFCKDEKRKTPAGALGLSQKK